MNERELKSVPKRVFEIPYVIAVARHPQERLSVAEIHKAVVEVAKARNKAYQRFIGREREYVKPPSEDVAVKVAKLMEHWGLLESANGDYKKTSLCQRLSVLTGSNETDLSLEGKKFLYHLILRRDYNRPVAPHRFNLPVRDYADAGFDGVAPDTNEFVHARLGATQVDCKAALYWLAFLGIANYKQVQPEERKRDGVRHRHWMFNVMHIATLDELLSLAGTPAESEAIRQQLGGNKTRATALAAIGERLSPSVRRGSLPNLLTGACEAGMWIASDDASMPAVIPPTDFTSVSGRLDLTRVYLFLPNQLPLQEFYEGLRSAYLKLLARNNLSGVSAFLWLPEVMGATCMALRITDTQFVRGVELLYRKRLVELRSANLTRVSEYFHMRPHRRELLFLDGQPCHMVRMKLQGG